MDQLYIYVDEKYMHIDAIRKMIISNDNMFTLSSKKSDVFNNNIIIGYKDHHRYVVSGRIELIEEQIEPLDKELFEL